MGKQWKHWQTLVSWAPEITADGTCRHKIKRCFLLGRKAMTHLDSVLKSRDITLLTKVCIVKALGFLVVMYRLHLCCCPNCWRRLLRVPWTARRLNQSILKAINPEYSLEGLILKLKLQYLGHMLQRTDSLEKILMLGRLKVREGGRGWDGWMASVTQWTRIQANSRRWWRTRKPHVLRSTGSQRAEHDWDRTSQSERK